ncbi:MAG TPA: hypothetical protein VHB68_13665, partial [Steroidobacteraceae bacterium]|nr:hypothetical protein [Steroidobacteraceae bacterium]
MALTAVEGAGPFSKIDKQTVIGILKAVGSRDPDMLHAQKQKLLAPSKNLKTISYVLMGGGGLLTITVFAAFAGIPLGLFGIWVWRRSARNTAVVEAAFTEFLAS